MTEGGEATLQAGDRVLVTGGAGFIGSSVVRELCARDVHVVAMVEPGATRPTSTIWTSRR